MKIFIQVNMQKHDVANTLNTGFPGGSDGKASTCDAGDLGSIPGSGRSPGEGNGYPFQYPCLENFMDRRAWWVTVHGVTKSQTLLSKEHSICSSNTGLFITLLELQR